VPNFARSSLGTPAPSIASTWIARRGHLLSWTIRACRLWLSLAADPFGNHCPEGFRRRIRRELALRLGTEQPDLPFREDKAFAPRHDVQMGEPASFNHRPRNGGDPEAPGDELKEKLVVFDFEFRVPRNIFQRKHMVDQLARAPARRLPPSIEYRVPPVGG